MNKEAIKNKLAREAIQDTSWIEKAKWERDNEDWLDLSFKIAVRIGSVLSSNKKEQRYPKNQAELAEALGCSAQYVNKLLKGQENLQIETICKIASILHVRLIEVPPFELEQNLQIDSNNWLAPISQLSAPTVTSNALSEYLQEFAGETNFEFAA